MICDAAPFLYSSFPIQYVAKNVAGFLAIIYQISDSTAALSIERPFI